MFISSTANAHLPSLIHPMQSKGVELSILTLQSLLKACASSRCGTSGLQAHLEAIRMDYESNVYVAVTLIDMYAKCGMLFEAKDVFDDMRARNVVAWNALLSGYVNRGLFREVLDGFDKMRLDAIAPDACTFLCILKACSHVGDVIQCREMHMYIAKAGLDGELYVTSAMVDSYAKCRLVEEARDVFERSRVRDVALWNTMLASFAESGLDEDALQCVENMEREAVSRSSVTYVVVLRVCGSLRSIEAGRAMHCALVKQGFWGDPLVGTAAMTMYGRCGLLHEAQQVFEGLKKKADVVAWTSLIASFVDHGYSELALSYFASMEQTVGVYPDAVAYFYCLKACGDMSFVGRVLGLHASVVNDGIDGDPLLTCTLVDTYAKCGFLCEAQAILDESKAQCDVVPWNSLIAGYALRGDSTRAFRLLESMCAKGVAPDEVTFLNVLSACTHGGLIDEGLKLAVFMAEAHGITTTIEQYVTMIDLFGRAGSLDDVVALLEAMRLQPNLIAWTAVLGACKNLACPEPLVNEALECAIDVDASHSGLFLLMLNLKTMRQKTQEALPKM
jgi:pentatricopeptide repeat protein